MHEMCVFSTQKTRFLNKYNKSDELGLNRLSDNMNIKNSLQNSKFLPYFPPYKI